MSDRTVYQFTVQRVDGEEVSLGEFRNKVLLIVNTASECAFTSQLRDLENLRKEFEGNDFEILAFPCNDFGKQEPLQGQALTKFCKINFHTNFKVFDKVHVRGKGIHPLFKFLSEKKYNGKLTSHPRWNFHKYLINKNGEVVDYFYSFTKPDCVKVKTRIQQLIEPAPFFV